MLGQAIETSPGEQESQEELDTKVTKLNEKLDEQKRINKIGLFVGIASLIIKIFKK